MFLVFWALYFTLFYINSYATSVMELSAETVATLLIIINAITIPARPILGHLSDHWFNSLLTMPTVSMCLACMLSVWIAVASPGGLYAWAVFYGLATGGTQGIFTEALAALTHDAAKMGTRFGMICSALAFATLAGPPTAGAQAWAGTTTLVGSLFIALARWPDVGAHPKSK